MDRPIFLYKRIHIYQYYWANFNKPAVGHHVRRSLEEEEEWLRKRNKVGKQGEEEMEYVNLWKGERTEETNAPEWKWGREEKKRKNRKTLKGKDERNTIILWYKIITFIAISCNCSNVDQFGSNAHNQLQIGLQTVYILFEQTFKKSTLHAAIQAFDSFFHCISKLELYMHLILFLKNWLSLLYILRKYIGTYYKQCCIYFEVCGTWNGN